MRDESIQDDEWEPRMDRSAFSVYSSFAEADAADKAYWLSRTPEERVSYIDGVEPKRIEVMTSISGVEFDECYRERLETTMNDVPVSLINLRDLKTNKKASGRLKDLADLEQLSR